MIRYGPVPTRARHRGWRRGYGPSESTKGEENVIFLSLAASLSTNGLGLVRDPHLSPQLIDVPRRNIPVIFSTRLRQNLVDGVKVFSYTNI